MLLEIPSAGIAGGWFRVHRRSQQCTWARGDDAREPWMRDRKAVVEPRRRARREIRGARVIVEWTRGFRRADMCHVDTAGKWRGHEEAQPSDGAMEDRAARNIRARGCG